MTAMSQQLTVQSIPASGGSANTFSRPVAQPAPANEVDGPTRAVMCTDKITYADRNPEFSYTNLGGAIWDVAAQQFDDFTGQVTQIDFQAKTHVAGTKTVQVGIFAIGTFTPLGSTTANITSTTSSNITATFSSPVSVTDGFTVVIFEPVNDSVLIMMNTTGNGGGYSYCESGGTLYNMLTDLNFDRDFLFRPTIKFTATNPVLTATPASACVGQAVNFTVVPATAFPAFYNKAVYNPSGAIANSLNFGDGTANATTLPANHSYTTTGSKTASVTYIYDGWTTDCTSDPSTQTITVNGITQSDFAWTSVGLSVTFINTSSYATSYSWAFGDNGTASAPNPVHNYTTPGTYTVELTATGPCGTAQHFTNITITSEGNGGNLGMEELENGMAASIYPNPAGDYLNVELSLEKTEAVNVLVVDALGRVVFSKDLGSVNASLETIDLSGYKAGVYLVRIIHDNAVSNRTFVKQ